MMTRRMLLALAFLICGSPLTLQAAESLPQLRLTLPPVGYAVVGAEMNVYFSNLILTENPDQFRFVVTSDLGTTEKEKWTVTPTSEQIGTHPWQIEVFQEDKSIAKGEMTWVVSPNQVKTEKEISVLIVGDSLTNASIYPNTVASRLKESGPIKLTMLGSHRPASAAEGVSHEGYGGWTWQRFVKLYTANPTSSAQRQTSPFVFLEGESPKLNVARYFRETCEGKIPDFIIFKLGINDCFRADPNSLEKTDQVIEEMFAHAETLLKEFREAAPNAEIAICLTTPGNLREEAFTANYKGQYTRWGWKRIQHRVVERQLEHFQNDAAKEKRIHIIPTELNLDPLAGYPANNAVHPNPAGYQQIGATIHAWLMSRLTEETQANAK